MTIEACKRYQQLAERLKPLNQEMDEILSAMDSLWLKLTPEEKDIVDPAGRVFRQKAPDDSSGR